MSLRKTGFQGGRKAPRPVKGGLLFLAVWLLVGFSGLQAGEGAQPSLPAISLQIGAKTVRVEVADDPSERSAGLMFRESLATDAGMLFVMVEPGPAGFWMRNTRIPLSIAYIDSRGTILEIHDMAPHDETIVKSTFEQVAYALEMTKGWFSANNIWPGERVRGLPPLAKQ